MLSLSDNYPFLIDYFHKGICSNGGEQKISHCLLFYGSDIDAQYSLALEIARLLNCKEGRNDDCQCLNCKWIRENKHPAVITVSRTDFKPDDDKTKTVISIRQTQEIRSMLMMTSDYHRVVIFCDRDDDGNLQGLNYKVFQEEAANSLLKTFEEPPQNTTFIILTKDKTDMISTIISRSQCFFVPSKTEKNMDIEVPPDLINLYVTQSKEKIFDFQNKMFELIKENPSVLDGFEVDLYNILKANIANKPLTLKIKNDLKSVEYAKRQLQLDMSAQNVIEELSYKLFNII